MKVLILKSDQGAFYVYAYTYIRYNRELYMYIQYTYTQPLPSLSDHRPASKKHNDMQEFMTKLTG
jgi:hypothetical protein